MLSVNKNIVKLSPFPLSKSDTSDMFAFATKRLWDDNTYALKGKIQINENTRGVPVL